MFTNVIIYDIIWLGGDDMTIFEYKILRNLINSEVERVLNDPTKDKYDVFMAVEIGISEAGIQLVDEDLD